MSIPPQTTVPLRTPLLRGERRAHIALVGLPGGGKTTLFDAVAATSVHSGELAGTDRAWGESTVQIGLDEAHVIDLPSIHTLYDEADADLVTLKYLLWGNDQPPISLSDGQPAPTPFRAPDVIVQVLDASALERHLELTLELAELGRPMVLALNRIDEARNKGLYINHDALSSALGIPVIATVAHMGQGIPELFRAAVDTLRNQAVPHPPATSGHIIDALQPLAAALRNPLIQASCRIPHDFLLLQIAQGDGYFTQQLARHFPQHIDQLRALRDAAAVGLPRPLADELHADRHHRAASLFESVTRAGRAEPQGWRHWLDELFLHPQLGLIGSLAVFAAVLFVVFEVSSWLDSITAARLIELTADWQPTSFGGVIARGITDGLIGLIGIVVPYMLPLVMLLIALEQSGIMQRIAFVVDRGFHHIGLHGGVAVSFLLGLGCNVPAISAAAHATRGKERVVAAMLITFVPCSARSAIILALAGKYLGAVGVLGIFLAAILVIAVVGQLLSRKLVTDGPGQMLEIPDYALPQLGRLMRETWWRTSDILTIVTPLLVGGSVVLAILAFAHADTVVNTLLTPITSWWLGLPVALGVPLLFGVLRKELSLLMVFQALGTFEVGQHLDWVQLTTFLLFLTFYVPCVSTFAVMLKKIGRREALLSVALSFTVALLVSGVIRLLLEGVQFTQGLL